MGFHPYQHHFTASPMVSSFSNNFLVGDFYCSSIRVSYDDCKGGVGATTTHHSS